MASVSKISVIDPSKFEIKTLEGQRAFILALNMPDGAFVNSAWQAHGSAMPLPVHNPAHPQWGSIHTLHAAIPPQLDAAVMAAKAHSDNPSNAWAFNCAARANALDQFVSELFAHKDELATLESINSGWPMTVAKGSIDGALDLLRGYAQHLRDHDIHSPTLRFEDAYAKYFEQHVPKGVVGSICPWNYPVWMMTWGVAAALASGNTVILKSSEKAPLVAQRFAQLLAASMPEGVFQYLPGAGDIGAALSSHPGIDHMTFTGSVTTGRKVETAMRAHDGTVNLETGGKSPMVIVDANDALLDLAVDAVCQSVFWNGSGQNCAAFSRVIIADDIYDTFRAKLIAKMTAGTILGDPCDPQTNMGPLVDKLQYENVTGMIDAASKIKGVTVTTHLSEKIPYFVPPTIIENAPEDSDIAQKEVFGPVVLLQRAHDLNDAVRIASNTSYKLAGAVFSNNPDVQAAVQRGVKSGTFCINKVDTYPWQVVAPDWRTGSRGQVGIRALYDVFTNVRSVQVAVS